MRPRILLAVESDVMASIYERGLKQGGYDVVRVRTSGDVRRYLVSFPAALILLDSEKLDRERRDRWAKEVYPEDALPLLILSSNEDEKRMRKIFRGAEILLKPFTPPKLVRAVGDAIEAARDKIRSGEVKREDELSNKLDPETGLLRGMIFEEEMIELAEKAFEGKRFLAAIAIKVDGYDEPGADPGRITRAHGEIIGVLKPMIRSGELISRAHELGRACVVLSVSDGADASKMAGDLKRKLRGSAPRKVEKSLAELLRSGAGEEKEEEESEAAGPDFTVSVIVITARSKEKIAALVDLARSGMPGVFWEGRRDQLQWLDWEL